MGFDHQRFIAALGSAADCDHNEHYEHPQCHPDHQERDHADLLPRLQLTLPLDTTTLRHILVVRHRSLRYPSSRRTTLDIRDRRPSPAPNALATMPGQGLPAASLTGWREPVQAVSGAAAAG